LVASLLCSQVLLRTCSLVLLSLMEETRKGGVKGKSGVYLRTEWHRQQLRVTSERKAIASRENAKKGLIAANKARYITDRTKLKTARAHAYDVRYQEWSKSVKDRDNWKCKISDDNCSDKLESHHILPWRDFQELRYELNNGITLCRFHHPKKRADEMKLSPFFQSLVISNRN
jgi:hypothetical protein